MPRLLNDRVPSYRRHKSSGQAIVTLNGKDHLLGPYGTVPSRNRYNRLIAEWLANGRQLPRPDAPVQVCEVLAAFLRHARGYYRTPQGVPSNELAVFKSIMRTVNRLYGDVPATAFGPLALKSVRENMIEAGLTRNVVNNYTQRVKFIFKWAAENEIVPASIWHGLSAVAGLRAGRSAARESEPVKPVPIDHVHAVLPFVSRQVGAAIRLQLLTGARPGEILAMRGRDLDTTGKLWTYLPPHHKTAHYGHDRKIMLGPKAQEIVRPFLVGDLELPLFSPDEAERIRREKMHAMRKTPMSCGNRPGSNRKRIPRRRAGDAYGVDAYRRAITRACEKAGVPHWHPHQLRHTAATELRKQYGLEAAQVILGHRTLTVTQVYAERNVEAAMRIMAEVG